MITTIFFDFDGVLTLDATGRHTTCKYVQSISHANLDTLLHCFTESRKSSGKEKPNESDMWNSFCSCANIQLDANVIFDAFRSTPKNEKMFALCASLKSTYQLGIITDNSKERFTFLREYMQLDSFFEHIILSADVDSVKTEEGIFRAALKQCNAQPSECVFIDNQQKNLHIPKEMGFQTYWHDDSVNDVQKLQNQLLEFGVIFS